MVMGQQDPGEVYGGYNWMQMAMQMAIQAAMAAMQQQQLELGRQQSTGYVQGGPFGQAPTREQAMAAVWQRRPDIQEMYHEYWGENADPIAAMENWLTVTTEEAPKADIIQYATSQGWIEPYDPGQMMPTLERQMGEGQLGLNYLQLLGSLSGPQDWITYWNTQRQAQNTSLPAWARNLQQGLGFPAWQGAGAAPGAGGEDVPIAPPGSGGNVGPSWLSQMSPITPSSILPQQFANMMPSEVSGLQGMVEAQGQYWPDFLKNMQAAWPTGRAAARTLWG